MFGTPILGEIGSCGPGVELRANVSAGRKATGFPRAWEGIDGALARRTALSRIMENLILL